MTDPAPHSASPASDKSSHAFRTITEVAADLDVAQHVLRFWETKFPQIKPMKRGGGRRYYRPEDVELLRRIRDLLYTDGFTIKGVQQLLRKGGETEAEVERRAVDREGHKALELKAVLAELEDLSGLLKRL